MTESSRTYWRCCMRAPRKGFTIIELMIVIAIFAIAAATTLPFLGSFQQRETVTTVTQDVLRILRTAQSKAMAGERDSDWGVRFEPEGYVLYAGNVYSERVKPLDRRHATPKTLLFFGSNDLNFVKGTGVPQSGSGFVRIDPPEGASTVITINAAGGIFLEKSK